jgi:hypothetical protein
MRRTATALAVLLCAMPLLAGCGDDDTGTTPASADDPGTVESHDPKVVVVQLEVS